MSRRLSTLAPPPHQPMAGGSSDPVVHETRKLVDDRVRVNAGPSTTNFKAGLVGKDWRTIPVDVVLAFMDQLSVAEIFRAAQVCTTWRTVALSHTSLWTRVEVRVTRASRSDTIGGIDSLVDASSDSDESEDDDSEDEDYVTLSNLYLLQHLLPRAQTQPLTVTITVPEPSTASFVDLLRCFLELVAQQLVALNVDSLCPELVQRVLGRKDWAFPMLRWLVCSSPNPGAASPPRIDFRRIKCPALAHLDLGAYAQVAHLSAQPALTYLRAHVRRLEHLLPLLLAAPAATRLGFTTSVSELGPAAAGRAATRAAVFAALNTLQEVCVRTQNDARRVDGALALVQRLQCPRVVLELSDGFAGRPFRPVLSGPWVDATQVVLRGAPDALEIVLTDATQRTLTIRLLCDADRMQPLEWDRVLVLHALAALRVDASVWSLAMRNFPQAPQLADTTLVVDGARGLDAVMEYSLGAMKRRMWSQKIVIEIGSTQVAVDVALEDELSWEVPQVPRGSRLTLSSDEPVSIAKWGLDDVMWRLGGKQVFLDGVSMGAHRSM